MAQFNTLTAVAAPIVMDNVDTDQIFPSRFTVKDRNAENFGGFFLHDHRFDEEGARRTGFILNDPRLSDAKIVVASANYACGSGRAGAVFSHLDADIKVVIAESFGPLFAAVAYKYGLLTIELGREDIASLRGEILKSIGSKITIDLDRQVIISPEGASIPFDIDPFVKRIIMEGLTEMDLTLALEDQIADFEVRQRSALPWVFEAS